MPGVDAAGAASPVRRARGRACSRSGCYEADGTYIVVQLIEKSAAEGRGLRQGRRRRSSPSCARPAAAPSSATGSRRAARSSTKDGKIKPMPELIARDRRQGQAAAGGLPALHDLAVACCDPRSRPALGEPRSRRAPRFSVDFADVLDGGPISPRRLPFHFQAHGGVGRLVLADLSVGPLIVDRLELEVTDLGTDPGSAAAERFQRRRTRLRTLAVRITAAALDERVAAGAQAPRGARDHAAVGAARRRLRLGARARRRRARRRRLSLPHPARPRRHPPARAREHGPRPRPPADAGPGDRGSHPRRAARRDRRPPASSSGRTRAGCATSRSISSARCCGT